MYTHQYIHTPHTWAHSNVGVCIHIYTLIHIVLFIFVFIIIRIHLCRVPCVGSGTRASYPGPSSKPQTGPQDEEEVPAMAEEAMFGCVPL